MCSLTFSSYFVIVGLFSQHWPTLAGRTSMFLSTSSYFYLPWALLAISFFGLLAGCYEQKRSYSLLSKLSHDLLETVKSGTKDSLLVKAQSLASLRMPDYRKVMAIGMLGFAAAAIGLWGQSKAHPVYEYHDVKVVKVIDPYVWMLAKNDGVFRAEFCRDYDLPARAEPVPGNVLTKLRYQDRGTCFSIEPADCGLWWRRDPNTGKAVIEN